MADDDNNDTNGAADAAAPKVNGFDGKLSMRKEIPDGNGGKTTQIVLREPTAGDIERIGNPVLIELYEARPKIEFDTRIMTAMLAHLASVPPSSIRMMHPKDWNNAAWMVANFFMPDL